MSVRAVVRLASLSVCALLLAAAPVRAGMPGASAKVDTLAPGYAWPMVDRDSDGVPDRLDRCGRTPLGAVVDRWGCPRDTDGDGVLDGLDQCPDTPHGTAVDAAGCSAAQRSAPLPPQAPIEPPPAPPTPAPSAAERALHGPQGWRLEAVYFESGSARLLPESEAPLTEAAALIARRPALRIEVQGHTDTRGDAAYNQRLSQARADAVRAWLLAHAAIAPEALVARGYGETRPETRERNEEERLRNRRIVLRVLPAEGVAEPAPRRPRPKR